MSTNGKPALGEAEIGALSRLLQEPAAMAERRQEFRDAYQGIALPDRVQHLWRYTDPHVLLPRESLPAGLPQAIVADGVLPQDGPALLLLPGVKPQVNRAAAESGVVLKPLAEAAEDLAHLGRMVPSGHGLLEALNGAAWTAGLLVKIPRGQVVEKPLRIVLPAAAPTNLPRLLILVEEGAVATVVEEHVGGTTEARVVGVSELLVAAGAQLRYVLLQLWEPTVVGHLTSRAHIGTGGNLFTAVASFGGAVAKLDLGAVLAGEGAQSELAGVALAEGRQHFDHHTEHRHTAGHTRSNLDFRVALAGRARSAYTGLIRIEENAPYSEAYQENRNLLLAEKCRADTIPELEILTDEVVCSHGATASPVDPEQLFYLESRGIPADEALRLVVRGFLEDTLRRIPENLRGGIEARVTERLARLQGGQR
jgi:Fe-S cluster assembly protein SufD